MSKKYLYIAGFGALGAGVRYGMTFFLDVNYLPLPTLLANLVGCFLLGFLVGGINGVKVGSDNFIIGLKAGFLGSFTTFSSFCFEGISLMTGQHFEKAFLYIFFNLAAGMVLTGCGLVLGENLAHPLFKRRWR